MSDKTSPSSNPLEEAATSDAGINRRRLVRAGLTAAPVMAALHSGTVLAGGDYCIRPSSFSSIDLAVRVSSGRVINSSFECKSHGYWKNHPSDLKSGMFLSSQTGFTENPGGAYTGKSLQNVLDMEGNKNYKALARHVVAAYLSAKSVSDAPARVLLSVFQCQQIWNGKGIWTPVTGAPSWDLEKTMRYFKMVFP